MKFLWIIPVLAVSAHASIIAHVTAGAGLYPTIMLCDDVYTAPPGPAAFDRVCAMPNPTVPSRSAFAELAAQGPMHLYLETLGGVSAAGCSPSDGCPGASAEFRYDDLWTITGGSGPGTLWLIFTSGGRRDPRFSGLSVLQSGFGQGDPVSIPFVFGEPFAFSFRVEMGSGDLSYGRNTWSLDVRPVIYQGTCGDLFTCSTSGTSIAGVVTGRDVADPFLPVPEPSTLLLSACALSALLLINRRR